MKLSDLGYPILSDNLRKKIFGDREPVKISDREKLLVSSLLGDFGISVPVDYPANLYDGDLPLPDLKSRNLKEHYELVAQEQIGHYVEAAEVLANCELPKIPCFEDLVLQPGWTRYEPVTDDKGNTGFIKEKVPHPLEKAFSFDTETFVHEGAYPIIGTAVSDKASYLWIASELLTPSIPKDNWDQFSMIPIGTDRFVTGHNISYDRIRAREGYDLSHIYPENFYFDTLSAHIGVSGLASQQRWLYVLSKKPKEERTEQEDIYLRYLPTWLDRGSTNSLVECYNFHYVKDHLFDPDVQKMDMGEKKIRDIFVVAEYMYEITSELEKVLTYAMNDALRTAELFQSLWPKYRNSTPSLVGLCGHYYLNGSIVPLVDNWKEWIQGAERVYNEHNQEMTDICRSLMKETYGKWKEILDSEGEEKAQEWVDSDPWNTQLDWFIKTRKGKYGFVPNWMRDYVKEPDKQIGVKSRLSHLLLKLKYEGKPLEYTREMGWCYREDGKSLKRVPHPKGTDENVGGLLSKDFVEDMHVGRLSSELPQAQRALDIANAVSYWTSVRKRVMSRITQVVDNPHGENTVVTLPEILCHGTVTRRTVESLFVTMCSTKNWRIGTELKTRVQAPDGWKIVGADFDGQEMQIASIYSDKWEGGHVGCSPFGYNVLSGSKESGTDPHTSLARAIMPELYRGLVWDKKLGVCELKDGVLHPIDDARKKELARARDLAKVVGFTTLYGGGVKAIQTYIRKIYPEKSLQEAEDFAVRAITKKKGILEDEVYKKGSDSGCFNFMEHIALKEAVSTLPCLGTKISTAMRRSAVGKDYKTGRVNWTIQSSGAEILSIILTSVHWLAREYKIPCRFILSIHDEVWFMTPEKYAEQFAVLFQIAHVYTWSLFHNQVGIPDLPLSRAYFSSVAIDNRVRKSPKEKTITLSNPEGGQEPFGEEYSMTDLAERGAIKRLQTRLESIQKTLSKINEKEKEKIKAP